MAHVFEKHVYPHLHICTLHSLRLVSKSMHRHVHRYGIDEELLFFDWVIEGESEDEGAGEGAGAGASEEGWAAMSVRELKEELRRRGLSAVGVVVPTSANCKAPVKNQV